MRRTSTRRSTRFGPPRARRSTLALASSLAIALAGCSEQAPGGLSGHGALSVEIWGEDYIESGIPADDFVDGWQVGFDRFLIAVGSVAVSRESAPPDLSDPTFRLWDLAASNGPLDVVSATVPAGRYSAARYSVALATSATELGNATAADLQHMVAGGYSIYLEGSATSGQDTIRFAWGFETATTYDDCHSSAELADGGSARVEITIHGDHFFYDSAVGADPDLRFADIALADADDDGVVTRAELEAYAIAPLPNYAVGSLDIDNLWEYLAHMSRTVGHIDGEGHCHSDH